MADDEQETLMRWPEVMRVTGLKQTKIREMMKAGEFPKPIRLSDHGRIVGWIRSEVRAWVRHRIELARGNGEGSATAGTAAPDHSG